MKSYQIAALTALLSVGAQAAPRLGHNHGLKHAAFHHKRDVVWETVYEVETVTVMRTVYGDGSPATDQTIANSPVVAPTPYTPVAPSAAAPTLPSPSETGAPAPQPPAPAPAPVTTSAAPAPAPVTTSAAPPPVYTSSVPAPSAPAPAPAPAPSSAPAPVPAPAPAPAPSSSSAPSGGSYGGSYPYTGDATHWDPALGACGVTSSGTEMVVALSWHIFDAVGTNKNPNSNPACGQTVNIKGADGNTYPATVVDRCTGCADYDLDMSDTLFNKVTTKNGVPGDGRVPGMQWGSSFDFSKTTNTQLY